MTTKVTKKKRERSESSDEQQTTKKTCEESESNEEQQNVKSKKVQRNKAGNYVRYQDRQLILESPGMYIGSTKHTEWTRSLINDIGVHFFQPKTKGVPIEPIDKNSIRMETKTVQIVPAVLHLFQEALVNAADAFQRGSGTSNIDFEVHPTKGEMSVKNNGCAIPCEFDQKEQLWIPEMIFMHLRTSSNYGHKAKNEELTKAGKAKQVKTTGGKNGHGAKLIAVFSKWFKIEIRDNERGILYKQTSRDNNSIIEDPVITRLKGWVEGANTAEEDAKNDYVKVSWEFDWSRFDKMEQIDDQHIRWIYSRVIDLAGSLGQDIKIKLNGHSVNVSIVDSFRKYMMLHRPLTSEKNEIKAMITDDTKIRGKEGSRWRVGLLANPDDSQVFRQTSFVNAIETSLGGPHVTYIVDQIVKVANEQVKRSYQGAQKTLIESKNKALNNLIRKSMHVFIDCLIDDPDFDTQTKARLDVAVSAFGSDFELPESFIKSVIKELKVSEKVSLWFNDQQNKDLRKNSGNTAVTGRGIDAGLSLGVDGVMRRQAILNVPKLEDANHAGTSKSEGTTLLLVEGDSAKALAMAGLSVVGRDKFGVFPLRGKFVNMAKESQAGLSEHKEAMNLIKIMGLQPGKEYKNTKSLRYSSIAIMVDQDSITGDTPLLLRDPSNGFVHIRCIRDVFDEGTNLTRCGQKEYTWSKMDCWTEKGWTRIQQVMRHKTTKRIYRVMTHSGVVDVTEDHSLLRESGEKITPGELHVSDFLMHSFPPAWYLDKRVCGILSDPKGAYVMGYFWLYGHCQEEGQAKGFEWHITTNNLSDLERVKRDYIDPIYGKDKLYIQTDGCSSTLRFNEIDEEVQNLISIYRSLFYGSDDTKQIPFAILNASQEVREQFFHGMNKLVNDEQSIFTFNITNKTETQRLFYLCSSLGWNVKLDGSIQKDQSYSLVVSQNISTRDDYRVKKIIDLGVQDDYVYDLGTENHHFQAGIGQMIVHNTDGSHIYGLVALLFSVFWPSLFHMPGFLSRFVTPIVVARPINTTNENLMFYTLPELEEWKTNTSGWERKFKLKYYKGLATSTAAEAKWYFKNIEKLLVPMNYSGVQCDEAFKLAFGEDTDVRKDWLSTTPPKDLYLNYIDNPNISFHDFVHRDLILFSHYSNLRSIPSVIDGMKPGKRKILFACFLKKLTEEIKVAQLAGFVSEKSAYHHGEKSLMDTIVGMAQVFVGVNNINLLVPSGMFGTRAAGGKDAGAARYIFTYLMPIVRSLFPIEDDAILEYQEDDGSSIEPEYYLPVLPTILVNGSFGMGTGWSSDVPSYNPKDLIDLLRHRLKQELDEYRSKMLTLQPWYRNFIGSIEPVISTKKGKNGNISQSTEYRVCGVLSIHRDVINDPESKSCRLRITELPLRVWTNNYKEFLNKMIVNNDICEQLDNSRDGKIDIMITLSREQLNLMLSTKVTTEILDEGVSMYAPLYHRFDLIKSLLTSNMHLHDENGLLRKYNDPEQIIDSFFGVRLNGYVKRREYLIDDLSKQLCAIAQKCRFIKEVIEGVIEIRNVPKMELFAVLKQREYTDNFDTLLSLPLWSLTPERYQELQKQKDSIQDELDLLTRSTAESLWLSDLDKLDLALQEHDVLVGSFYKDKEDNSKENIPGKKKKIKVIVKKKKSKVESVVDLVVPGVVENPWISIPLPRVNEIPLKTKKRVILKSESDKPNIKRQKTVKSDV